jgi:hypothetical protein
MQGGAATLSEQVLCSDARPDVLLVSDMLNLPSFLGLTRRRFAEVPVALYCHENQLTYPLQSGEKRDLTYGMINWLSMLAADAVCFNSTYHLETWFDELPRLLKHFPDHTHLHRVSEVRSRARVLPVGCDLKRLDRTCARSTSQDPPLILWNQRWEYDKAPQVFFCALDMLVAEDIEFEVALAGANVRNMPEEFEAARARLGKRVIHYGWADVPTYTELLCRAHTVVSTALHEFFGIAVVEAVYGGCFPVLPRRLAYPELIPLEYHQHCLYDDFDGLLERLRWSLAHRAQARRHSTRLKEAMARYDWEIVAPRYDYALETLIS